MRRLALVLVAVAGCTTSRTIGQPSLSVHDETLTPARSKVDILFMIDNSPSVPEQDTLRRDFPHLIERLDGLATAGLPASYHIGVIDSDMGAGPFTLNQGQCHPDGDGGKLRTAPVASAVGTPAACSSLALADPFIGYDQRAGTNNLGGADIATAFDCISAVGDAGCGFEHPLEAIYRALEPATNPGFVRDDALLVVVWLTDEDDCSAPTDSLLFDPSVAGVATYGGLHSFRCTQWGITCDGKPLDGSALAPTSGCTPVVGGPLFDVSRYVQLFAAGGVKRDAADVLVVGINAPSAPFGVTLTSPCADQVNTPSCPILNHSCISPANAFLFADPGVRLNAVLAATPGSIATSSICDTDYTSTMDALADAVGARLRGGCLPGAVVDVLDPGCHVTVGGADTPRCSVEGALPCWDLNTDTTCAARPTPGGAMQQLRFVVEGAKPDSPVVATCPLYEPTP
jgi:hypothetical protein